MPTATTIRARRPAAIAAAAGAALLLGGCAPAAWPPPLGPSERLVGQAPQPQEEPAPPEPAPERDDASGGDPADGAGIDLEPGTTASAEGPPQFAVFESELQAAGWVPIPEQTDLERGEWAYLKEGVAAIQIRQQMPVEGPPAGLDDLGATELMLQDSPVDLSDTDEVELPGALGGTVTFLRSVTQTEAGPLGIYARGFVEGNRRLDVLISALDDDGLREAEDMIAAGVQVIASP